MIEQKNDNRPLMSDEELTALEAEFMERYKGSEKHPIRTLLSFYKGQYHLLCGGGGGTSHREPV